jgi:hypothetical protein
MRTHNYLLDMARPQPDSVSSLTENVAYGTVELNIREVIAFVLENYRTLSVSYNHFKQKCHNMVLFVFLSM